MEKIEQTKKKMSSKQLILISAPLVVLLVFASHVFKVTDQTSPQHITISLRNTATVAKGAAQIRLMPDEDKNGSEAETVSNNPRLDVKCNDKELHQIKVTNEPSETVCGIQVEVLRVYKGGSGNDYPYADLEVTW